MTEALVNPEMLRWARERVGLPPADLARALRVREERVLAWERGERRPTFRQAERWAVRTHVPFGYLYLDTPPEPELPIPDLRRMADGSEEPLSADVMDLLEDTFYKHAWYREYLEEIGAPEPAFVGSTAPGTPVEQIAADIRTATGLAGLRRGRDDDKLRAWFRACEDAGIWVLRTGHVGSNTHRVLRVTEFRGFAIADRRAPLVFINGRDVIPAQFFTLAHELAHIWLGESGISNPPVDSRRQPALKLERLCNRIAAEVLAPAEEFRMAWQRGLSLEANVAELTRQFPASRVVLARRAADLALVDWDDYAAFYEAEKARWEKKRSGDGNGRNFYGNSTVANGRRFVNAVLAEAMSGRLLLREAGRLLGMRPDKVVAFARRREGNGEGVSAR